MHSLFLPSLPHLSISKYQTVRRYAGMSLRPVPIVDFFLNNVFFQKIFVSLQRL